MTLIPILLEENSVAYINPEFVSSVVKNPQTGVTNLFMIGDENPYSVNEDVEQLAKKISSAFTDVALAPSSEPKVDGVPDFARLG